MSSAAEIAAGLTRAQRELLDVLSGACKLVAESEYQCAMPSAVVGRRVTSFGGLAMWPTPLGLEVRRILQETPDD